MQAAAPRSLWADEIVNMDETDVAFSGWFWSLVSSISPRRHPDSQWLCDSSVDCSIIQSASALPTIRHRWGERGGCRRKFSVHPLRRKHRWQAWNRGGHLASFSIQSGNSCCKNFGLSWHVLLSTSSQFVFLHSWHAGNTSGAGLKIRIPLEIQFEAAGCHVLCSFCDMNTADSPMGWFNLTQKVKILRCEGWMLKRAELGGRRRWRCAFRLWGSEGGSLRTPKSPDSGAIFVHKSLCCPHRGVTWGSDKED